MFIHPDSGGLMCPRAALNGLAIIRLLYTILLNIKNVANEIALRKVAGVL